MRVTQLALFVGAILAASVLHAGHDFERPPVEYSRAKPENRITQLQARLDRGELALPFDEAFGYLPAVLKALEVKPESQMLVFSKTSLQRQRISPRTPRAIYFSDDIYLGYCHEGDLLELSVADPKLGAVFYTLVQQDFAKPKFVRQTDRCTQCHATSRTDEVPGHLMRSVFVERDGSQISSEGGHRFGESTPIEKRFGGWYVTGTHGSQTHLGNLIMPQRDFARPVDNTQGHNVTDLSKRFDVTNYLTPHSDIVALLVLEHQVAMHNLMTMANFATQQALYSEKELNRAFNEPESNRRESTRSQIKNVAGKLIDTMLFVDAAKIDSPIAGTTTFAADFAKAGPRDRRGRSLREFDLKTRMFKYPCSYLIQTLEFDQLPEALKAEVAAGLKRVLKGEEKDRKFAHLSADDRQAIWEILSETKPELWKSPPTESDKDAAKE